MINAVEVDFLFQAANGGCSEAADVECVGFFEVTEGMFSDDDVGIVFFGEGLAAGCHVDGVAQGAGVEALGGSYNTNGDQSGVDAHTDADGVVARPFAAQV